MDGLPVPHRVPRSFAIVADRGLVRSHRPGV